MFLGQRILGNYWTPSHASDEAEDETLSVVKLVLKLICKYFLAARCHRKSESKGAEDLHRDSRLGCFAAADKCQDQRRTPLQGNPSFPCHSLGSWSMCIAGANLNASRLQVDAGAHRGDLDTCYYVCHCKASMAALAISVVCAILCPSRLSKDFSTSSGGPFSITLTSEDKPIDRSAVKLRTRLSIT